VLKDFVFTSESVSPGHPDKVADQISDAVLDAFLKGDKKSRVAVETLVKNNLVILAGEVTSTARVDLEQIARDTIEAIGYTDPSIGFDSKTCSILVQINPQSPDIAQGVNEGEGTHQEQGAGDQGLMFGYACNETPELMPLPIYLAHQLTKELNRIRTSDQGTILRPDAKSQVSIEYKNGKPHRITTIVVSTQHSAECTLKEVQDLVINKLIPAVIPANLMDNKTVIHVNPTGIFEIGGPVGDCGVTGRKIIVDSYGGWARHGGGAFSGKDPSKVDRSAAYGARYIAKNVVAAGLAEKCEVQLAYAIGVAEPVSVLVDTFGTGTVPEAAIAAAVRAVFNLTPSGLISDMDLLKPIYQATATFGHFGRTPGENGEFSWERTDKAEALKVALNGNKAA
jgi:S-adenosylmethionine synthetase